MGFSSEWEQRYAESTHLSVWPWSDIVSLVHRHCKPIIAGGGEYMSWVVALELIFPYFSHLVWTITQ